MNFIWNRPPMWGPKTSIFLLTMRLCLYLLLFFNLSLSAVGIAQQKLVNLKLENVSAKALFREIQRQTGYFFVFNSQQSQELGQFKVTAKDKPVDVVLRELLEGKGYTFYFEDEIIVLTPAQTQKQPETLVITGRVTNMKGEPLPGVTVRVSQEGTTRILGTATQADGSYGLTLPPLYRKEVFKLIYTFVGMQPQEVNYTGQLGIDVVMTEAEQELDAAMVTGYQTLSKERATGSFEIISKEHLSRPTSNIASRLVGVAAGVQTIPPYGDNPTFEIRGQSSLNKSNARPLLVVDGFPIEGNFSSINPNDVESVTILKDAAAASIWGARSANGVIVVTTKQGTKSGVNIEASAFVKVSPKIDLDYYNPLATSAETIEYEQRGFNSDFFGSSSSPIDDSYRNAGTAYSQAVVAMNEHRLGYLSEADMNTILNQLKKQNNKDQIRKYLLQIPLTHQYNVNISGANQRMNNMLSLLYEHNQNNIQRDYNDKFMVNYRNRIKLFKWMDFNFSGSVQYTIAHSGGGSLSSLSPYDMLVDEEGNRTRLSTDFYAPILERYVPTDKFPYSDWTSNPITEMENTDNTTKAINARIQGGLTLHLLKGLDFDTKFHYEMYNTNTVYLYNEESMYVRRQVNTTSFWDRENNTVTPNLPKGGIRTESKSETKAYNFRNQLSFVRTFAERHAFNAIAGMEISERVSEGTKYPTTFGYDEESLKVGTFPNGITDTKNWMGYKNSPNSFLYTSSYTSNTDRYFSLFANASYTFDDKYTVSGSVRTDASNLITDDPEYRYSPFWSVGLSWRLEQEDFLNDISWLDRLNFRATYGYNGNVDKSTSFLPLLTLTGTQDAYIHDYTAGIQSYGNPTLRWEKTGTVNVGVDYSFMNGKLFGKIDVYHKSGKDLIATINIPVVNGTGSQALNAAEMSNRGVEVEIGTQLPVAGKHIVWSGNLNFSYNKNKIRDYYKDTYSAVMMSRSGTGAYVEGYDANSLWVFEYGGVVNQGSETSPDWQPVIKVANGEVCDLSSSPGGNGLDFMKHAGTRVAPWGFGFSNSFRIYDFNVSFLLTGKFGHKFMRTSFNYPDMDYTNALPNKYYAETVNADPNKCVPIPNGKEPKYRMWGNYLGCLDYLAEDAAHIRLQEVCITYTMPSRWLSKIGISSLQIFAQGNNICTWMKNKYKEDPEFSLGSMKPQPTYTFSLRFGFLIQSS